MGYGFKVKEDIDSLDVFLSEISKGSEELGTNLLKSAGEKAKDIVVSNLRKHKRILKKRYKISLSDDVKLSIRTDKYGEKYAKVMGGKETGTIWHIVNDGNLHSQPTHFMDSALKELDGKIDDIWKESER